MFNLLKRELFKLRHSTGFTVMLIISVVFGILSSLSFSFGETLGSGVNMTGHDAYFLLFSDLRVMMLIFAGAFSGIFIGEDFSRRSFQAEVALGNSRFKVLLNKTLIYLAGICLMIFTWIIIVLIGTTLVNGFGEPVSVQLIGNMIRAGMMFSLHICACSILCVIVAVILKNKGSILAVNFLILVIVDGMFQLISFINEKGLSIYAKTPFIQALISSSPRLSVSDLLVSIAIGLAAILSLFSISYIVFKRCELQ